MRNLYLIFLISLSTLCFGQNRCEELIKYRDAKLISDYDLALKKYLINQQQIQQYKKLKKQIEEINFGTLQKTYGQTVLLIGTTANLAKEMIEMVAPELKFAEKVAFYSAEVIKQKFIEGKPYSEIINEKIISEVISSWGQAVSAAKAFYDYSEDVKKNTAYSLEANELVKKIQEQNKNFDWAIDKYQRLLSNQQEKMSAINEFANAIDKYCSGQPVIEVSTNLDCKFSIDMGTENLLIKDDKKELKVDKGGHVLIAKSNEKGLLFNTNFNVPENQPTPVQIKINFTSENDSIKICDCDNDCGYYKGHIIDGKANGKGICKFFKGDVYEGYYQDNKKNGQGILTWTNGYKYDGEWKDDKQSGQGTFTATNGYKYEGEWKAGERNGQGTAIWPSGDKYIGAWKDNTMNGHGTYFWGPGAFSGNTYVGEYKDGKMDGQGTHTWLNGDKYVGEWKEGKQYNGIEYTAGGSVGSIWKNGVQTW